MSKTNEITSQILDYLLKRQIFAYRNNVGAFRTSSGFYQFGKTGSPDIIAILPPAGHHCGIELKVSKSDKLRSSQIGYQKNSTRMGATYLVISSFEDFHRQFDTIFPHLVK